MSEFTKANEGMTRRALIVRAAAGGGFLLFGGTLGACAGSDSGSSTATTGTAAGGGSLAPKTGGNLRIGLAGGGAAESIDAQKAFSNIDQARLRNLYARLVSRAPDFSMQNELAEEITPNADGSVWTVRLLEGAEFHDGKTIGADDLMFTVQRIFDTKAPVASLMSFVDPKGMKKLDDRTVEFTLLTPTSLFSTPFGGSEAGIVPVGYDPAKPIGSGPFSFESFTAGQQSVFNRFDNYFREPAFVDKLTIISFQDDASRVNALLGGQVDAIETVPFAQIPVIEGTSGFTTFKSDSAANLIFTMRVDTAPFDDVRVRQAMRLIVDREQMVQQALAGYGTVANDLFCRDDPAFASDIPQRKQDIAEAKRLLAEAGKENLEVELVTAPVQAGLVEACQVFAEQAKAAGVKVTLRKLDPNAYFEGYGTWPFSVDYWDVSSYFQQMALNSLPTSTFNTGHFDDPEFNDLYAQGVSELDETKRNEIARNMQEIEHERGAYIVWCYRNLIDGLSAKVTGIPENNVGLSFYSYSFRLMHFL